ncbi:MAG: hypothetical protein ACLQVW_01955 [Limisphaerales bacterium]
MKPDFDRIDDAVLALLSLTSFGEERDELEFACGWNGRDWVALDRNFNSETKL